MEKTQSSRHRVWLHIGMPKTGTTAIQAVLYANRKTLLSQGIFYPDFGNIQHVALARRLAEQAGSTIPFPSDGDCGTHGKFTDLLGQQIIRPHTSIISSEYFFQRPACLPGVSAMPADAPFDLLSKTIDQTVAYFTGCDVTVLMWLRRQDNWLMSMYNQTIKSSLYSDEFRTFADRTIGVDLLKIVHLWVHAFGRERVICHAYDTLSKSKINIVDSFLQTVCPDVPYAALNNNGSNRNPSLSNEALWLKKRINALVKVSGWSLNRAARQRVDKILAETTRTSPEPNRPLLTNAERKALMARFLVANEKLVADLDYPELLPLTNLDDLSDDAESTKPTESTDPCHHAIDQMIKAYVQPLVAT